jgi:hypothetical protein
MISDETLRQMSREERAGHWTVTWVGFDIVLLGVRRLQAAHGIVDAPSALLKVPLFGVPREPATENRPR